MGDVVDLQVAAVQLAGLLRGVRDDQLGWPTPCGDWSVDRLCQHVLALPDVFTPVAAAPAGVGVGVGVDESWRERGAQALVRLAEAWLDPDARVGTVEAGGVVMPAAEAAVVALDELVLHGWDLARATDQDVQVREHEAHACLGFASSVGLDPQERAGLYGPVVPVPAQAPVLHRLLGASGRSVTWARPRPRAGRTTFVLVHGAWSDGRSWEPVARVLSTRGHAVLVPTLRGLEACATDDERARVRLVEQVDQLVGLLESEDLDDVALVSHSWSGVVVGQAVDRLRASTDRKARGRVRRSVHVAAYLPRDGRSLLDDWGDDEGARQQERAQVVADGYLWTPPPAAALEEIEDFDDQGRRELAASFLPHPGRTVIDSAVMRRPVTTQPCTVVLTAPDAADTLVDLPPELQQGVPGAWRVTTLEAGHWPMLTVPTTLADLLETEAVH